MKHASGKLKSYHVMYRALAESDEVAETLFARSIRRVTNGYVEHSIYAAAARLASVTLRPKELERRLRLSIAADANPIGNLFVSLVDEGQLKRRWNAFNALARLGVRTRIHHGAAQSNLLVREPQTPERDDPFRSDLIASCLGMLLPSAKDKQPSDIPQRLLRIANSFNLRKTALTEVLEYLHAEPALDIKQLSKQLGCCTRTLQRALRGYDLTFALVKQAVRLSIAGYRFRNVDEPIVATAQAAGFFDSAHLNHAWSLACDVSPSEYRSLCRC
jgi:AraC-like DNA-binding protein